MGSGLTGSELCLCLGSAVPGQETRGLQVGLYVSGLTPAGPVPCSTGDRDDLGVFWDAGGCRLQPGLVPGA